MATLTDRTASCPSNLFRQLYISIIIHLLVTFQNGEGYLTEKPQDAVRAVGQSVTFTCNSSWTDSIRWFFSPADGTDKTVEELGTNAVVRLTLSDMKIFGEPGEGSPDGYRSVLTISEVTRWHAGTFRCQDGTGSRGSARLTVTSTPETVCLTVSPRDQVVVAGDSAVLTASSPSANLRYYYVSVNPQSQDRVELYDGEELNDCAVDERYSVVGLGDKGHADLVIRAVQTKDAGRYIVKDVRRKAYEVAANIVVFERFPECTQVWHLSNDHEIQLQCHAEYTGLLTPRVSFLRQDVTEQFLQKTVSGGIIRFQKSVKISDLESSSSSDIAASSHFEIGFELSQCGEPAGTWTWKHVIPASIERHSGAKPRYSMWHRYPMGSVLIVTTLAASAIFNVILIMIVVSQCRRMRRNTRVDTGNGKSSEGKYDRLDSTSSSSSSVWCKEAEAGNMNC